MLHSAPPVSSVRLYSDCPGCGHPVTCPSPRDLTRLIYMTEQEEALLEAFWQAARRTEPATFDAIFAAIYADDPEGGPPTWKMREDTYSLINSLVGKAGALGFDCIRVFRNGFSLRLLPSGDQTRPASTFSGKNAGLTRRFRPLPCHCCTRMIEKPSLEMVMHHRGLQPRERQIVRAIDRHRGIPTLNEWLYSEMYFDAPSPPEPAKMYSALKVAISNARKRLRGSGAMIRNVGYNRGYMIVSEACE